MPNILVLDGIWIDIPFLSNDVFVKQPKSKSKSIINDYLDIAFTASYLLCEWTVL